SGKPRQEWATQKCALRSGQRHAAQRVSQGTQESAKFGGHRCSPTEIDGRAHCAVERAGCATAEGERAAGDRKTGYQSRADNSIGAASEKSMPLKAAAPISGRRLAWAFVQSVEPLFRLRILDFPILLPELSWSDFKLV